MFKKCLMLHLHSIASITIHMDGNRILTMKRRSEPSTKLQLYIPIRLKAEIERQAAEAGQLLSVFVQRALAAYVIKAKATAHDTAAT